jgi:hypothetical protein
MITGTALKTGARALAKQNFTAMSAEWTPKSCLRVQKIT